MQNIYYMTCQCLFSMYYTSDGKLTFDGLECKIFYVLDLTYVDNVVTSEISKLNIVDLLKEILKNVVTLRICYTCVKTDHSKEEYEYIVVIEANGKYDVFSRPRIFSWVDIVSVISEILKDYYGWRDKKFILDFDKKNFVKQVISEVIYSLKRILEKDIASQYMDELTEVTPS